MKSSWGLLAGAIWAATIGAGFGQAPPNDHFANRTFLTGNDITFIGDLTGSTVEPNERWCWGSHMFCGYTLTNSIWWSWTAAETTPVHLVARAFSTDTFLIHHDVPRVAIYATTDVFGATPILSTWLEPARDRESVSFQAIAGTSYQIQLVADRAPFAVVTFQLIATNPPVILEGPKDQTVFPNGSALFTVLASSLSPLGYQWCSNGIPLPGATSPMLAFDTVPANATIDYSVIVTNATGVAISAPATLKVASNAIPPVLRAVGPTVSNSMAFTLQGESGRYYRIESSTNLVNWTPENSFPLRLVAHNPMYGVYGSVIHALGSNVPLAVPRGPQPKFVRASTFRPADEVCANHLRQIRFAKDLWFRTSGTSRSFTPVFTDLEPYVPNLWNLSCPLVPPPFPNSYLIDCADADPLCQVSPDHKLEHPR